MIAFNRPRPVGSTSRFDLHRQSAKSIVAASFAYARDDARYEAYCSDLGEAAAYRLRWPFWRIVAGSWVVARFPGCQDRPVVEAFETRIQPECDETDIVDELFEALTAEAPDPDHTAQLVTWGAPHDDVLSLRRVAQMQGRILPPQLRSAESAAAHRIRLSELTCDGREQLHLAEYVRGLELRGIPVPGHYLPHLVREEAWAKIAEHCAANAMLTAICAARHFASEGIGQAAAACTDGIVEAFCKQSPTDYVRTLSNWHRRYRYDRLFGEPGYE